MSRRYAVLCDYGLDDAVATVHLLDNLKDGDRLDVVPVGGNSEVNVAYRNAQTLLYYYKGDKSGVRIIDTRKLGQPWAKLPSIHGEDGMGDLFKPRISGLTVVDFADWLKETEPLYVVSLGPCTVTLEILRRRNVSDLLIMGGCVNEVPNFHGYEFNHYLDIPAFNECVKFPHVVATLDSCRVPRFNLAGKERSGKGLIDVLINRSIELAEARHPDNCYIYDYIAVQYATNPETFETVKTVDREGNVLNELRSKG